MVWGWMGRRARGPRGGDALTSRGVHSAGPLRGPEARPTKGTRRPACRASAAIAALALGLGAGAASTGAAGPPSRLVARVYDSGFPHAHDTYNGIGAASNGRIFYVLSSERHDVAGQMFVLDPAQGRPRHVADLDEAVGQKGRRAIAQGKSHVNFVEADGRLYFATHIGFYSIVEGMETMGIPPAGFSRYPGGHLLSYDLQTGRIDDLSVAPHHEGVLTMNVDGRRRRIYALTWPGGYFFRYDLVSREQKTPGRFFEQGARTGRGPLTARSADPWPSIRRTGRCTSRGARARSCATGTTATPSNRCKRTT
jgi:hypothetical protein